MLRSFLESTIYDMAVSRTEKLSNKGVSALRDAAFQFSANNQKVFVGIIKYAVRKDLKLYISFRRMAQIEHGRLGVLPASDQIQNTTDHGIVSFPFSKTSVVSSKKIKGGRQYDFLDERLIIYTSVEKILAIRKVLGMAEQIPMPNA